MADTTEARSKHRNGCVCPVCDTRAFPCGFAGCDHISHGKLRAGQHEAGHRRRKRRRYIHLTPDGLGFLRRALSEKTLAQSLNLSGITRFQAILLGGTSPADAPSPRKRSWRMTKIDKIAMEHFGALPPQTPVDVLHIHMNAGTAHVLYKLALLAGVAPRSAVGALLVYGLEHLNQELRVQKTAQTPSVPAFAEQSKPTALFPKAN